MFVLRRTSLADHAARLQREVAKLDAENSELKTRVARDAAELEDLRQQLRAEPQTPASFADAVSHLRALVSSLPASPGYHMALKARDAESFAQAVHLMMLDARAAGFREGKAK